MTENYIVTETNDWLTLSRLFAAAGMEIVPSETPPAGIVKMWLVREGVTPAAAVTFELRDGVPVLGRLGVLPRRQRQGYGKLLQGIVFEEARRRGYAELWGCAKEPAYYTALGWQPVAWEGAPDIATACRGCVRRGATCFPQLLKIGL